MAVEDCFVLCIDWENGASLPNYVRAAANSRLVNFSVIKIIVLISMILILLINTFTDLKIRWESSSHFC